MGPAGAWDSGQDPHQEVRSSHQCPHLLCASGLACLTTPPTPASSPARDATRVASHRWRQVGRKDSYVCFFLPAQVVSYSLRRGRISNLKVATYEAITGNLHIVQRCEAPMPMILGISQTSIYISIST